MKHYAILLITLFSATNAFSFSKEDLKSLKTSEGFYLLESTKEPSEEQRRICLEGQLEFNESEGILTLGGTALAVNIYTKENEPVATSEKNEDGCTESTSAKMVNKNLLFESSTSCPADKTEFKVNRVITFKSKELSYKQSNTANSEKIEVECRLKKSSKKHTPMKIEAEVEEIKTN